MPEPLPQHVQWLATHRGPELKAVLDAQGPEFDVERALAILVLADPSPGAHAVQWMFDTLVGGGMLWEDVAGGRTSKAGETLGWFAQYRADLPRSGRNLATYDSLASVYVALSPLLGADPDGATAPSGKQAKRMAGQTARKDSIILHASADLVVAVPLTRAASCWWGRGTRWCTAASQHNMFDNYNRDAPLIVVVMPGVESQPGSSNMGKLQMCLGSNDRVIFMDAADQRVKAADVGAHWNRLEPLMTWALTQGHDVSHYIPRDLWRGRIGELIVSIDDNIRHIPEEHRTRRICMAALGRSGYALEHVPDYLLDADMCRAAVECDGGALMSVPREYMSAELCATAIRKHPMTWLDAPEHLRTRAQLLDAIRANVFLIAYLDESQLDLEIYTVAVQTNGNMLNRVPREYWTPELLMMAVKSDGRAISIIPADMRTPELAMAAVEQDGVAIKHLDEVWPELEAIAVKGTAEALEHLSYAARTPELCEQALRTNPSVLTSVPEHILSAQMCSMAVQAQPRIFSKVPQGMRTPELCRLAVGLEPAMIRHVPEDVLDADMCTHAVQANGNAIERIPIRFLSAELCAIAVAKSPNALECVPHHLRTLELCVQAVAMDSWLLEEVPNEIFLEVERIVEAMPERVHAPALPPEWSADVALEGLAKALEAASMHTQETIVHEVSVVSMSAL